jgi:ubiquinone/menaquinone biosynthesis C-methylase UbiE
MTTSNDEIILAHYRQIAQTFGASPRSSMEDDFVREKELEWILTYRNLLSRRNQRPLQILDVGCGNGYTLNKLCANTASDRVTGLDFSEELLNITRGRNLPNCTLVRGDVRQLPFEEETFDYIYTERCLINILDPQEQIVAIREIARVLKTGGDYLMIECFTDGLANNNKARADCGLPPIPEAHHNKYFEKDRVFSAVCNIFAMVDVREFGDDIALCSNFLSSHYFIARVLHPSMLRGTEVVRNSEVAKFFSFLPPMGNYSPIQAFVLRKV